jgi:hypothetical protein
VKSWWLPLLFQTNKKNTFLNQVCPLADANKAKAEEKFKQYWMDKFRGGEPNNYDTVGARGTERECNRHHVHGA